MGTVFMKELQNSKPDSIGKITRRDFLKTVGTAAVCTVMAPSSGTANSAAPSSSGVPTRLLGKTAIKVPMLGFGGDGLVSDSTDREAVEKLLNEVLDSGVTFIDTAHRYGNDGLAEKNIGLIAGTARRKEIFLATKTGDRTYDGAMAQVEESLRRLRTDRLDLIQVHHICARDNVSELGRKDGALRALWKLQEQKVVRFIGLTGHPQDPQVREALETYPWDTFMCFVNPSRFSSPALQEQLPLAVKKNIGIIAMKTFGGRPGMLVGEGPGKADARSLLRFAWTMPVTVAIPGIKTRKQLMDNLEIARSFQPMSLNEMESLKDQINAGQKGWRR
jgi:uncharacterized protein